MIDLSALGIVAIGRNEGERLRSCLSSIPQDTRTVYVDSASTDDSVAIAQSLGAEVVHLHLSTPFTAARARNAGFARLAELAPKVKFVQFIDGDCELERTWLGTALDFLERNPQAAAVCGRRRERHVDASIYNRLCDDEWNTPIGEAEACGGDVMMRAEAFKGAGGYDAALIAGEEPELCARLRDRGWQIWRLDASMTVHDAAMERFSQWWKRALRSGYGYAQVWHKTRSARSGGLYGRELWRAVVWAIGVPLAAVAAALAWGPLALLLAPLLWVFQLGRLGLRYGFVKGAHLLLSKAAECIGAARYAQAAVLRRQKMAIYYK
uniref:glycosyltransferase n=1 Tax=Altererythrobacter segetis TaxID=1104773 RepID=UPI001A9C79D7|nr:glycosyltransferase [Altererythrobacter segetis]